MNGSYVELELKLKQDERPTTLSVEVNLRHLKLAILTLGSERSEETRVRARVYS